MWKSNQQLIDNKEFMTSMLAKGYPKEQILETVCTIGKYKYDFESRKGKISMIQLSTCCPKGWVWEIYAYENGKLFRDVMRFKTKEQAIEFIGTQKTK